MCTVMIWACARAVSKGMYFVFVFGLLGGAGGATGRQKERVKNVLSRGRGVNCTLKANSREEDCHNQSVNQSISQSISESRNGERGSIGALFSSRGAEGEPGVGLAE